jgi:hypothetical protein
VRSQRRISQLFLNQRLTLEVIDPLTLRNLLSSNPNPAYYC